MFSSQKNAGQIKLLVSVWWEYWFYRNSHQRCFVKKVFLEILQNSQENTCARASFLIKLQVSYDLLKKLLQNTSGGLFLITTTAKPVYSGHLLFLKKCPLYRVLDFPWEKKTIGIKMENFFHTIRVTSINKIYFKSFVCVTFSVNSLKIIFKWSLPLTSMKFFISSSFFNAFAAVIFLFSSLSVTIFWLLR